MKATKVTRSGDILTVIPLDDVKRALGIYDNEDDDEITSLIYAAFHLAERYCYRCFSPSSVIADITGEFEFYLPYGEDVIITSVEIDGVETTEYLYNEISGKFKLNDSVTSYESLRIEYTCGFTELPPAIDRAIKYLVSTMLNSGQDFVSGMDVTEIPFRSTMLLDTEKHYVI